MTLFHPQDDEVWMWQSMWSGLLGRMPAAAGRGYLRSRRRDLKIPRTGRGGGPGNGRRRRARHSIVTGSSAMTSGFFFFFFFLNSKRLGLHSEQPNDFTPSFLLLASSRHVLQMVRQQLHFSEGSGTPAKKSFLLHLLYTIFFT